MFPLRSRADQAPQLNFGVTVAYGRGMTRFKQILAITTGLFVFGAVAGGLAGAVVAVLVILITEGPREAFDLELVQVGLLFGAPLGAVLLPLAGWLLMRRVPLGRAALWTMVGTILGGLVGWFTPLGMDAVNRSLLSGLAGFALAVLLLRRSAATRQLTR